MKQFDPAPGTLTAGEAAAIDQVIADHGGDETQLVGILLDVQAGAEHRYISQAAAVYVAKKLGLKITRVYDVISFYTALNDEPQAKFTLEVCSSAPCHVNGAPSLVDTLREVLGIGVGETSEDGRYALRKTPCFGACDVAPAVRCNGKVFGHLTDKAAVTAMLKELEGGACG